MKIGRLVIRSLCLLGLWLGLGLQAHAQSDTVTYVYTDPQGTPLVEADAQGNVVARYDYTPYGSSVVSLGNPPDGPGYTGHVNDPETGLVYMQARYYQPFGRFLSPDPAGSSAGNIYSFNQYAYADNNPIKNTDPTGGFSANLSAGQKECLVYNCSIQGDGRTASYGRAVAAMSRANKALQKANILGRGYTQMDNLAIDWSAVVSPITTQMQVEIGSDIYLRGSSYFSSPAYSTGIAR